MVTRFAKINRRSNSRDPCADDHDAPVERRGAAQCVSPQEPWRKRYSKKMKDFRALAPIKIRAHRFFLRSQNVFVSTLAEEAGRRTQSLPEEKSAPLSSPRLHTPHHHT